MCFRQVESQKERKREREKARWITRSFRTLLSPRLSAYLVSLTSVARFVRSYALRMLNGEVVESTRVASLVTNNEEAGCWWFMWQPTRREEWHAFYATKWWHTLWLSVSLWHWWYLNIAYIDTHGKYFLLRYIFENKIFNYYCLDFSPPYKFDLQIVFTREMDTRNRKIVLLDLEIFNLRCHFICIYI